MKRRQAADFGKGRSGFRLSGAGRRWSCGPVLAFFFGLWAACGATGARAQEVAAPPQDAGATAQTVLRIASYDPELSRDGPGLLLRDLRRGADPQIAAVISVLLAARPDVLLLTGFDWDHQGTALRAFAAELAGRGLVYDHLYAPRPNSGMPTGLDMDGNGRTGEARDAQGYGRFSGQNGMALLSRLPIERSHSRDFSGFLWRDLPDTLIDGAGLSAPVRKVQRLSSTGHWDVALRLPAGGRLHLWAYAATPPVFDGPEDRNGRRNHDETAFWGRYVEGRLKERPAPGAPYVVLGQVALDPDDGEGRPETLRTLLLALGDPRPGSPGAEAEAQAQAAGARQGRDPALATARYGPPTGNLRLDYVLPAPALEVVQSGVWWPAGPAGETAARASRHRLVWVDIRLP